MRTWAGATFPTGFHQLDFVPSTSPAINNREHKREPDALELKSQSLRWGPAQRQPGKEEVLEAGPALSFSWWKWSSGHVCLEQMLGAVSSSTSSLRRCSYIPFFQGYIKMGKEMGHFTGFTLILRMDSMTRSPSAAAVNPLLNIITSARRALNQVSTTWHHGGQITSVLTCGGWPPHYHCSETKGVTRKKSRWKPTVLLSGGDAPRWPPSPGGEDLPWKAALGFQLTCTALGLLVSSRSHQVQGPWRRNTSSRPPLHSGI